MKRDWNDEMEMALAQPRIVHRLPQPFRDGMPQLYLAIVFELQNDKTNQAAAAISGDRSVESECSIRAVRAGELTIDCPAKGLGTFCTKRGNDALRFVDAILANVIVPPNRSMADGAQRRVKKR